MLVAKQAKKIENVNDKSTKIINFPYVHLKADGTPDMRYGKRSVTRAKKSTKMECLYTKEDVIAVYNVFKNRVEKATTFAKKRDSRRNLCMYVCAINIGLRGGDFCALKWRDIFDNNWIFKTNAEYVPSKTKRCNKHVDLIWSTDFESVMLGWLAWKIKYEKEPDLNDYIFPSQKGGHIESKRWWSIMEKARKEAGVKQKIGTNGLRKTMVNQYIKNADDKAHGLMEMSSYLGHSDLRITERYACIEKENIKTTKEKMAFLGEQQSLFLGQK